MRKNLGGTSPDPSASQQRKPPQGGSSVPPLSHRVKLLVHYNAAAERLAQEGRAGVLTTAIRLGDEISADLHRGTTDGETLAKTVELAAMIDRLYR